MLLLLVFCEGYYHLVLLLHLILLLLLEGLFLVVLGLGLSVEQVGRLGKFFIEVL